MSIGMCFNDDIPWGSFKKENKMTENIDINKIIDDAIEKKDRSVMIFINGETTSVSINPIEGPLKWKTFNTPDGYISYKCPNCGVTTDYQTQYCSECGEKLAKADKI